ncbi:MAG: alpha/beta hydrolase [Candidatus Moraniibacteriota bacterium]|nr:MAG: alpha/beta hydrolase [Candidatus Moranbacteria bacterium]
MQKVVIVHCWDGYPDYCWYSQTKKELQEKGFEVLVPEMPETGTPNLTLWLPTLQALASEPNESLHFVGHSAGCITILRYLEQLKDSQKIGKVILVAGFTDDLGYEELKNFFTTPILFEKIKQRAEHFVAIHSDNDPFVDLKYGTIFKEKLGADLIIKNKMGHFSGERDKEGSCVSLPEVSEALTR